VFIQFTGTLYLHHRARQTGLLGGLDWRGYLPRRAMFLELSRLGFPSSLTMLTVAIGIFVVTWYVGRFGHEAVAAYGIATRIEQIVLLPVMGLNVATLTLVAQNSGARQYNRVRETIRTALKSGITLMCIGTLLVFVFADHLMRFFTADPPVRTIGVEYLRIVAFLFHAYVILYINSFALQGLQRPQFALYLGIFRQFLAPVPVIWLLATVFGWGVIGVWWGVFSVNWLAAGLSLLYIRKTMRELLDDDGLSAS